MPSCPSSVRGPSTLRGGGGGGVVGVNLKNASITLFLFYFDMELIWDDINHISKDRFG